MRTPPILAGALAATAAAVAMGLAVAHAEAPPLAPATTPIKHLVVIFDENVSFDHYFGTYPNALNPPGQPRFEAKAGTPSVNGLSPTLLTNNPNSAQPQRLDRAQAVTCSQNHGYSAEQKAFDGGLMDRFVEFTSGGTCDPAHPVVMDYYDGNTVTGLWNLAQRFALSDNHFATGFGPSTVGAINLISGRTHGAGVSSIAGAVENGTIIGDPQPALDDCGDGSPGVTLSGRNVGDLLNDHHVSWGWFQGGFKPTSVDGSGRATCASEHRNLANAPVRDYVQHHEPFQYYASTANPHHLPPSSVAMIGSSDQANHQYDLTDFDAALAAGNLPSVSFLKPAAFEDGHPSSSDPLDEQRFIARTLNALQNSPAWDSTAVIVAYDDSDGWYDHVMPPITSPSAAASDALSGPGRCGNVPAGSTAYPDRCGLGPRLPLLVVSPWAKQNFVDHSLTDQTSILRLIEDNWQLGPLGDQSFDERAGSLGNLFDFGADAERAPKVYLDPETGLVTNNAPTGDATPSPTPASSYDFGSGYSYGGYDYGSYTGDTTTSAPGPRVKLSCTGKRHGKRLTVACKATGADAKDKGISVRFRLYKDKGTSLLATTRKTLVKARVSATLKAKKSLKKGRYRLLISLSHNGGVTGLTKTLNVK